MLIHVTKFVDVQDIVYKQVNDYLFYYEIELIKIMKDMKKQFLLLKKFGKKSFIFIKIQTKINTLLGQN